MAEWFKAAVLKTTGDSELTDGKRLTKRLEKIPGMPTACQLCVWRGGRVV